MKKGESRDESIGFGSFWHRISVATLWTWEKYHLILKFLWTKASQGLVTVVRIDNLILKVLFAYGRSPRGKNHKINNQNKKRQGVKEKRIWVKEEQVKVKKNSKQDMNNNKICWKNKRDKKKHKSNKFTNKDTWIILRQTIPTEKK